MQKRSQIHYRDPLAIHRLTRSISEFLEPAVDRMIAVLCIGTDRATGDALGPLVGRTLSQLRLPIKVYGSVKDPVGANNLAELSILLEQAGEFVIAVDASLGSVDDVGKITVSDGPLHPGTGVGKQLPAVGNISILGCVNIGALAPMQVLQCTRLDTVMEMSDVITYGLSSSLRRHFARYSTAARDELASLTEAQSGHGWRPLLPFALGQRTGT